MSDFASPGAGYVPEDSYIPDNPPKKPPPDPGPGGDPPGNPGGGGGGGGGGNGGGGGGGSGGGGGGGGGLPGQGGGSPPPPPPTSGGSKEQDRYVRYLEILQSWGLQITGDMIDLAHEAANKHWATGTYLYYVRQTDWYKEYFKGIRPGMSEGQYISLVGEYQKIGNRIGEHIGRDTAAYMIAHNISVGEFSDRVTAVQRVDDNPQAFTTFIQTLRARGVIKRDAVVKKEDLLNFVLHRGPDNWRAIWEEAQVRLAASEAGFLVGHNITRAEIMRVANQLPGYTTEEDVLKGFQQLAQNLKSLQPIARTIGMHVSRWELEQLSFGGPAAAAIKAKYAGFVARYQAALTPTVQPQLVQTAEGAKLLGGLEGLSQAGANETA